LASTCLTHREFLLEADAAVAEALHVDGEYRQSAHAWEQLADSGFAPAEAALKAAIAFFSLDDEDAGFAWLHRARGYGCQWECDFAAAQLQWRKCRVVDAIGQFRAIPASAANASEAAVAVGVLCWKSGRPQQAREEFLRALQIDPQSAEALINLYSMAARAGGAAPGHDGLRRAAILRPHRYEPHALYGRWLCTQGRATEAALAFWRARLRRSKCGATPNSFQPSSHMIAVEACATAIVGSHVSARVTFRLQESEAPPLAMAVNAGYSDVRIGSQTLAFEDRKVPPVWRTGLAQNVRILHFPPEAWLPVKGAHELTVELAGRPIPPCAAVRKNDLELAFPSAWLPVLLPRMRVHWAVKIDGPKGWEVFPSTGDDRLEGVDVIAVHSPLHTSAGPGLPPQSIECLGGVDERKMRPAAILATRMADVWSRHAGLRSSPHPPLVIVDRSESTFCYTRSTFIRVPSGVLRWDRLNLICHEVGHLWWGSDVRIPDQDKWLAESLAEYSFHLAEDAQLLQGYRAAVLDRLSAESRDCRLGLKRAAENNDSRSARVLREKGGFVLRMLRNLLGPDRFTWLLETAYAAGRVRGLDAYTFCALASRSYGQSLNWFFNQWVYSDAELLFAVEDVVVTRRGNHEWALSFATACKSAATPGAPVPVSIQIADGASVTASVQLELGSDRKAIVLDSKPVQIAVDPAGDWYAKRIRIDFPVEPGT
jgi:hypothetical protein